jgi:hypothetical protein
MNMYGQLFCPYCSTYVDILPHGCNKEIWTKIDNLIVIKLVEQYNSVISVNSTHPEDIAYDKVLLKSISKVLNHNMCGSDFEAWQKGAGGE